MRLAILLVALWSIVTTGTAQAQVSAVEYGEINNDFETVDFKPACYAKWINMDGTLGLDLFAYHTSISPGFRVVPAAGDVIEFSPPVVLGSQPYLAFAVKYLPVDFPVTNAKPFLRVQYADDFYVTMPLSYFREEGVGNGYYYHILDKQFPRGGYGVKRIAVVARGNAVQYAHYFVGAFDVAHIKSTKSMEIRIVRDDPLFLY